MVRRISTLVAALAVGVMIYAIFTGVILHRIATKLIASPICLHSPTSCPSCPPKKPPPAGVPIFGVRVPLPAVVMAAGTLLAMPLIAEYMTHRRRRRRYLEDECVECGRPITSWRGRCPGCGVRIGPG